MMRISIIIPAYNEERYLPKTLEAIRAAEEYFLTRGPHWVETIVVDNDSQDRTREIASTHGCRVVTEMEHNIGKVRNAGAAQATGDVLVFVDADVKVPVQLLDSICRRMENTNCVGGAVDVEHAPASRIVRFYLALWRWLGMLTGMAQGATQFCRRTNFFEIGGYDESVYMGEDVEFYWKMKRYAKQRGETVAYLDEIKVAPSARRFDAWPIWKTVLLTNPLLIALFRKRKWMWRGWYSQRRSDF